MNCENYCFPQAREKIIEHTENDDYWGDGGDGKGKNKLGQILMVVRAELTKDNK